MLRQPWIERYNIFLLKSFHGLQFSFVAKRIICEICQFKGIFWPQDLAAIHFIFPRVWMHLEMEPRLNWVHSAIKQNQHSPGDVSSLWWPWEYSW